MRDQWLHDLVDRLVPLRDRLARSRTDNPWRLRLPNALIGAVQDRRAKLSRKTIIIGSVSLAALALAVAAIVWQLLPGPDPDQPRPVWFLDLGTGQVQVGMSNEVTALGPGQVAPPPPGLASADADAAIDAAATHAPTGAQPPTLSGAAGVAGASGAPGAPGAPGAGSPLVRAYIYSCGSCDDPRQRFIGFLETYTPEAHQAIINRPPDRDGVPPVDISEILNRGHLVAAPPNHDDFHSTTQPVSLKWQRFESDEGAAIVEVANTGCPGGKMPVQCLP